MEKKKERERETKTEKGNVIVRSHREGKYLSSPVMVGTGLFKPKVGRLNTRSCRP